MSDQDPQGPPPTEDELRAAYEAELKQLRVEDVVVQTIVSLLNLGGRKAGLAPGTACFATGSAGAGARPASLS